MNHKERRACFICSGKTGHQLFEEKWGIVGVGCIEIGCRVCSGCGLVLQDPVVPRNMMDWYYSQLSNYTNPSRLGSPSKTTISHMNRQVSFLSRHLSRQGKAFQVGCSNGYTLHVLEQAGWSVNGIDISPTAINIARNVWGLELEVGDFDKYKPIDSDKYDLVVLTHVLEHLYDPIVTLKKIRQMLKPSGYLFIEVPALVNPDYWPPGYFSFEHLNYFSLRSITNILALSGYQVVGDIKLTIESIEYPVMTFLASPSLETYDKCVKSDYKEAVAICQRYMQIDHRAWQRTDNVLRESLQKNTKVIIWGAGMHTSQLIARTGILGYGDVDFIVDSDPQKWGLMLGRLQVKNPNQIRHGQGVAIVISSHASEEEIYRSIAHVEELGTRIVRLYS